MELVFNVHLRGMSRGRVWKEITFLYVDLSVTVFDAKRGILKFYEDLLSTLQPWPTIVLKESVPCCSLLNN